MTTKPSSSRRKFLATLGAGGAAAAAVALTRQGAEPELKSGAAAPLGKGYQVTEHVRNYYRTAKV
jgi:hypothetical protein